MPEYANRDAKENALARLLSRLSASMRRDISAILGDPPDFANITFGDWERMQRGYLEILSPELQEVFVEMALQYAGSVGYTMEYEIIISAASQWASSYSFELVRGINNTSRTQLQALFGRFFNEPVPLRELTQKLTQLYGPVRAEMIAVTEVTRAASAGQALVVSDLRRQGVGMISIWRTQADEIVCPICSPRDGKLRGDGWTLDPPAHVRCRCWREDKVIS